jgi:hypothetical protein
MLVLLPQKLRFYLIRNTKSKIYTAIVFSSLGLGIVNNTCAMGLRSFVALPVEKEGSVVRLAFEHAEDSGTDILTTSVAYGISSKQTLLLGIPYRFSPSGGDRQGDLSVLYRHTVWQEDTFSGTRRLGLLGGVIIPTEDDRDSAAQAGFVFTHVKNRHEIDIDALYQVGSNNRSDSGRYDMSWQYRLSPTEYPDWGIKPELNSVIELNGRWSEGNSTTHQVTVGLQRIHQKWVIEGGVVKDIINGSELRYILSIRFHF